MKKLKILALLSIGLFFISFIASYYAISYPADFKIIKVIREDVEWNPILWLYATALVFLMILSKLIYRKLNFASKFYTSLIVVNSIAILSLLNYSFAEFQQKKASLEKLSSQFIQDAQNDIKNDQVKRFTFGMAMLPFTKQEERIEQKQDSILKHYGLSKKSLGCSPTNELSEATSVYEAMTAAYLEKRNGKHWKAKMEKALAEIK